MPRRARAIAVAVAIAAVAVVVVLSREQPLVIRGATLIDGTGRPPVDDAIIVIDESGIVAAGPSSSVRVPWGAEIVDAAGRWLIPGLIDFHTHLKKGGLGGEVPDFEKNLTTLLGAGITTVFVPGTDFGDLAALKQHSRSSDPPAARFFGSGPMITALGRPADHTPSNPEEARAAVGEIHFHGADAIKLLHDDFRWATDEPLEVLSFEIVAAVVDEAHRRGLAVLVHAPVLELAKEALRAGADGLMHGIISDPIDDELIDLLKKNDAFYMATLGLYENLAAPREWVSRLSPFDQIGMLSPRHYEALGKPWNVERLQSRWDRSDRVAANLPVTRTNLLRVREAGIPMVIGSDTGLQGMVHGISMHMELHLHADLGISPAEVLRAATIQPARVLDRQWQIGTVEEGKEADLLILDADPLDDIRNTRFIHRVVRAGRVYSPDRFLTDWAAAPTEPMEWWVPPPPSPASPTAGAGETTPPAPTSPSPLHDIDSMVVPPTPAPPSSRPAPATESGPPPSDPPAGPSTP